METVEQIQTPEPCESPASEIPPQPAATAPPEPQTPEPDRPAHDEAALTAEISELWRLHGDFKGSIKSQTENLRSLRSELGKKLSEMKQLLARPGCAGGWSGWLRERQISRATADRLVLKFEPSLNPDSNRLTESITEPTESEIQNLFDKIAPKLRRVLPTPASAYRFIELLTCLFALDHQATEVGLVIAKPSQKTELAEPMQELQHEPAESPVELVPVIADVQAESSPESAGTSMAL